MGQDGKHQGIGRRLRSARERAGLSREALAFHSGVSWSAIAQVEAGRRTNLRPGTVSSLAATLNLTLDYLISGVQSGPTMLEHGALLYESDSDFLATATRYLEEGLERSEAVIAITSSNRIRQLRRRLGASAERIQFSERTKWYSTPAAALDRYRELLDCEVERGAQWVRILGEPVWPGDSEQAVDAWARYESLLNIVFCGSPVTVLCPYDLRVLDARIISHARATHPHTVQQDAHLPSVDYIEPGAFVLGA